MNIVITGGAGFLGQRLARQLLVRGTLRDGDSGERPIDRIVLVDVVPPPAFADDRIVAMTGDIADPDLLARAIDAGTTSIFHLAAIVSGMAEADFELGLRINVDATRLLLDICRRNGRRAPGRVHQFDSGLRRGLAADRDGHDRRQSTLLGTGRRRPSRSC